MKQNQNKSQKFMRAGIAIIFWIFCLILNPSAREVLASDEAVSEISQIEQRLKDLEDEIRQLRDEADVRKKLEPTETEQTEKEKDILSAAGRQYTLLKKNTLGLEYRFNYSYNSYDIITQTTSVEQVVNHTLTNNLFLEYGLRENIALNTSLPFVYKYDRTGTSQEESTTDLGDISLGVGYQPLKSGGDFPTTILYGTAILPSGRSQYDINVNNELATGSGAYGLSWGASVSKTHDPVVIYGSMFHTYYFPVTDLSQTRGNDILREVDLGQTISASIGMAYSISYKVSLNLTYSYTYGFSNEYTYQTAGKVKSGSTTRSSFSIGTGWRVSPSKSISLKLNIGLTNDDPDFSFSFRLPFNFDLSKKNE